MLNKLDGIPYRFEIVEGSFEKNGKPKKVRVLYFPDKRISTITETYEIDGEVATRIKEEGMTKAELIQYFPPIKQRFSQCLKYHN